MSPDGRESCEAYICIWRRQNKSDEIATIYNIFAGRTSGNTQSVGEVLKVDLPWRAEVIHHYVNWVQPVPLEPIGPLFLVIEVKICWTSRMNARTEQNEWLAIVDRGNARKVSLVKGARHEKFPRFFVPASPCVSFREPNEEPIMMFKALWMGHPNERFLFPFGGFRGNL